MRFRGSIAHKLNEGVSVSIRARVKRSASCVGEDFVRNLGIADLDFATTHVYPSSWGIPASQYKWVNDNWIGDRAALVAANGKPLLMEVHI